MSIRHTSYTNSKGKTVIRHTTSYKDPITGVRHTATYLEDPEVTAAKRKKDRRHMAFVLGNVALCVLFIIAVCLVILSVKLGSINIKVLLLILAFAAPLVIRIVLWVMKKKKAKTCITENE